MTILFRRVRCSLAAPVTALVAALGGVNVALAQATTATPSAVTHKAEPPTNAAPGDHPVFGAPLVESIRVRLMSWRPFRPKTTDVSETTLPAPALEELHRLEAAQASLVELAAAKLKADEAAAPARRAAIRYLASVRCQYSPEAEAALIAALRADGNETVRGDAAQALAAGCCRTRRTRDALLVTASGSERDGNPAETSERVKAIARQALQRYAAQGMPVPHPDMLPPAVKPAPRELELTGYTVLPAAGPLVTEAERRFAETAGTVPPAATPAPANRAATSSSVRLPALCLAPIGVIPATKR